MTFWKTIAWLQKARLPQLHVGVADVALVWLMLFLLGTFLPAALAGDVPAALFVAQSALTASMTLIHRPARPGGALARHDHVLAWTGTLLPLAMRPEGLTLHAPMGTTLLLTGLVASLASIVSLGRSFGVEPAHRGVQTGGLYRLVRHPIYLSYLMRCAGLLLAHGSIWNGLILALWLGVQVWRIRREERHLAQWDDYRAYQARVRWRLIPFLW